MESLHIVDTRGLLWEDNSISVLENEKLFSYVQLFIKKSGGFLSIVFIYLFKLKSRINLHVENKKINIYFFVIIVDSIIYQLIS